MRRGLIVLVVLVVLAGVVALMTLPRPGGGAGSTSPTSEQHSTTPSDRALRMVRDEIARAETARANEPTDWLADARAWVTANREAGWPYAEAEARALAFILEIADGRPVSVRAIMRENERQIDEFKTLDADGDGEVSDEEVAAYAAFQASMSDPRRHPYLIDHFDADGDGVLGPEETTWMDADVRTKRLRAMADRARIDQWDTDNNGTLSEAERTAGHASSLLRAQIFPDGHVEYVPDPGPDAADAQAAARETLAAEFGQEVLDFTLERQEMAAEMYLTLDLGQEMELIAIDRTTPWEDGPPMPDTDSFDRDGDGSLNQEELEASVAAMEEWERAQSLHIATQAAERLRAMFDAQVEAADTDFDGLVVAAEWDRYREGLLIERDNRLFARHYDLDGSGRIEPGELETFVEWYRAGSLRADVNYDGSVDVLDLEDIATRYQAQAR
ncbi:MAG: hypothetical protein ACF8R9_00100 [Phycisphaerales bacterium JB054]